MRGTNTHGVEDLPRGGKTSGVTLEGNRVPGADGQGRGGDENYSATRDTEGSTKTCRREEMESDMELASPPITLRNTAEGYSFEITMVSMQKAFQQRRWHQAQEWRARAPRLWLTGDGGGSSRRSPSKEQGRPQRHHRDRRHRQAGDQDRRTGQAARAPHAQSTSGRVSRTPQTTACAATRGGRRGNPHSAAHSPHAQPGNGGGHPDQAEITPIDHPGDRGKGGNH